MLWSSRRLKFPNGNALIKTMEYLEVCWCFYHKWTQWENKRPFQQSSNNASVFCLKGGQPLGHQAALQTNMVPYMYAGIVDSPIIDWQSKH